MHRMNKRALDRRTREGSGGLVTKWQHWGQTSSSESTITWSDTDIRCTCSACTLSSDRYCSKLPSVTWTALSSALSFLAWRKPPKKHRRRRNVNEQAEVSWKFPTLTWTHHSVFADSRRSQHHDPGDWHRSDVRKHAGHMTCSLTVSCCRRLPKITTDRRNETP